MEITSPVIRGGRFEVREARMFNEWGIILTQNEYESTNQINIFLSRIVAHQLELVLTATRTEGEWSAGKFPELTEEVKVVDYVPDFDDEDEDDDEDFYDDYDKDLDDEEDSDFDEDEDDDENDPEVFDSGCIPFID